MLIKLNQIGTVTETVEAIACAARRGGAMSSPIARGNRGLLPRGLRRGVGGGQLKTGSAARSERLCKYNRLLEIESELGGAAEFRSPFA